MSGAKSFNTQIVNKAAFCAVFFGLGTTIAFANQKGTSTATFLRISQGARAEGMGGAFTAIADDPHAVSWNPAGIAQIARRELALDYLQFIEDVTSEHASLIVPVNTVNGSLGVAVTYVDLGSIDRRDGSNAKVGGDTDVLAYAGTVSWGQALGERLAIGFGGRFLKQDLAGYSASGFAGDAGLLVSVVPNRLSLAASAVNFGPKIKTGTVNENIPLTYRAGAAFYLIPNEWVLAVDGQKERDTDFKLHAGSEFVYQRRFAIRAGYQETHEAKGGLSAGGGFIWRHTKDASTDFFGKEEKQQGYPQGGLEIRFDYAFVDYGDFDSTHRVGIIVGF